jgi:RING-box protein 1
MSHAGIEVANLTEELRKAKVRAAKAKAKRKQIQKNLSANDVAMDLKGKKRFQVKKFTAVAAWSWNYSVDLCAICRNTIVDRCIECEANQVDATLQKECDVAWGLCNHAFHFHCISRFVYIRQVCPLCNLDWEFQRYGSTVQ